MKELHSLNNSWFVALQNAGLSSVIFESLKKVIFEILLQFVLTLKHRQAPAEYHKSSKFQNH